MYGLKRLEKRIQFLLGQALLQEAKNPLLRKMSITRVELSGDRRYAKVYVSFFGAEQERKEAFQALERAKPFLQGVLGRALHIRRIPKLTFFPDGTIEKSLHYEELFRQIQAERQASEAASENPEDE